MQKNLFLNVLSIDDIETNDINPDIATFFGGYIGIFMINLININLTDTNFDEDNPGTIFLDLIYYCLE